MKLKARQGANIKISDYSLYIVFCVLLFPCQQSFSQSSDWMLPGDIKQLKTMGVVYRKPIGFKEVSGIISLEDNTKFRNIICFGRNQLYSKNNKFIAFNMIDSKIYGKDTTEYSILVSPGKQSANYKELYLRCIELDIERLLEKKETGYKVSETNGATKVFQKKIDTSNAPLNWKEHVNFYPTEEAMAKFKADVAISYSINLEPEDYYQNRYSNLWVLVLQKKDRGFIRIYCFHENIPATQLEKYKAKMEGIFMYKKRR